MLTHEWLQLFLYLLLLVGLTPFLGEYMFRIYSGRYRDSWLGSLEKLIYRLCGIDPTQPMSWKHYAGALLMFNGLGLVVLLGLQLFQSRLPLNPQDFSDVPVWLAFNTAISFVTNTNWQAYSGEATLSYFTQMAGLGVQNFLSAASGMAVLVALARALSSKEQKTIGNFWVDLSQSCIFISSRFR